MYRLISCLRLNRLPVACCNGYSRAFSQNVAISFSRCSTFKLNLADRHDRFMNSALSKPVKEQSRSFMTTTVMKDSFNVQDTDDFKERVLNSDKPVVVDFHATWCGPCKMLAPRLEAIIASKGDKIHLAKVDIDNHTDLAMEYGVTVVPSVFGVKEGKPIDQFVGVIDDDKIHSFVDKLIGPVG